MDSRHQYLRCIKDVDVDAGPDVQDKICSMFTGSCRVRYAGVHLQLQVLEMDIAGVLLVLLAVDAGRDVRDQVGEKIANSLSHFSAKQTGFIPIFSVI